MERDVSLRVRQEIVNAINKGNRKVTLDMIKPETDLVNTLKVDEYEAERIAVWLEQAFDIGIPSEDYEHVATVQDWINLVQLKLDGEN